MMTQAVILQFPERAKRRRARRPNLTLTQRRLVLPVIILSDVRTFALAIRHAEALARRRALRFDGSGAA